jgi:hypothetical protein
MASNKKQDNVSITFEEFSILQNQILQLKQEKYEFIERENKRKIGTNNVVFICLFQKISFHLCLLFPDTWNK